MKIIDLLNEVKVATAPEHGRGSHVVYRQFFPVAEGLVAKGFTIRQATDWIVEKGAWPESRAGNLYQALQRHFQQKTNKPKR